MTTQENRHLPIAELNRPFTVQGGAVHFYEVELPAGHFVHAEVEQDEIEVALRFKAPGGELLAEIRRSDGGRGVLEIVGLADSSGVYRIEVAAGASQRDGRCTLTVQARRPATERDRAWVAAQGEASALRQDAAALGENGIDRLRDQLRTWIDLDHARQQADTLLALGKSYLHGGETDLAIAAFERALGLYRALDDRPLLVTTLAYLGSGRNRLGQTRRALQHFEEAVELLREAGSPRSTALMLQHVSVARQSLGDLRGARMSSQESLALIEDSEASDLERARVHLSHGNLLVMLQRPMDARRHFETAEGLFRRTDASTELAGVLIRLAHSAYRLDDFRRARAYHAEGMKKLAAAEPRTRRVVRDQAVGRLVLGRLDIEDEHFQGAVQNLLDAVALGREARDKALEATALLDLGRAYLLAENPVDSLARLQEGLQLFHRLNNPTGVAVARARMAETLISEGRSVEAWRHIQPALDVAELHRVASDRSDMRVDYFAFRQDFFDLAIDILWTLHRQDPAAGYDLKALETHERRRNRSLLDGLELAFDERPAPSVDPALIAREADLEKELGDAIGVLTTDVPASGTEVLLDQLQEVRGAIRQERQGRDTPPTAPAIEMAAILEAAAEENTIVLVISLGDTTSYLWAVFGNEVEVFELPKRQQLEPLAVAMARHLPRINHKSRETAKGAARRLSEAIFGPVADRLTNQRLVVVPTGELQRIAYGALPRPGGSDTDYLILDHEIVVLPSLSFIVAQRKLEAGRRRPKRGLLALGDPVFHRLDPRLSAAQTAAPPPSTGDTSPSEDGQEPLRSLDDIAASLDLSLQQRLEGSRLEVEGILPHFEDQDPLALFGFEANWQALKSQRLGDFRVLHLATHAFQNPTSPEYSGLILSLLDEQGVTRKGVIRAFEVSRFELAAELVVLSACETGQGQAVRGEGVLGLTRSFFDAGASRVISSLWKVRDQSTAELMTHFYWAYEEQGMTPSQALRHAQLELLRNQRTREPSHWAGFMFQGEWRRPGATD